MSEIPRVADIIVLEARARANPAADPLLLRVLGFARDAAQLLPLRNEEILRLGDRLTRARLEAVVFRSKP